MFFVNGMNEAGKAAGFEVVQKIPYNSMLWPASLLSFMCMILLFRRGIKLVLVVWFHHVSSACFGGGLKQHAEK